MWKKHSFSEELEQADQIYVTDNVEWNDFTNHKACEGVLVDLHKAALLPQTLLIDWRCYSPTDRQRELYHNFSVSCHRDQVRLFADAEDKTMKELRWKSKHKK